MSRFLHDVRFGLRSLVRAPSYTLPVLLILGAGVGTLAAVFSLVNGVLWRPLPYERPEDLYFIMQVRNGSESPWTSAPNFRDLRERTETLADLAVFSPDGLIASGAAEPESIGGAEVSVNLPVLLGLEPTLGRAFSPADADAPVTLISHAFRVRQFGRDDPLGATVELDGRAYEVIGVLPPVPLLPEDADIWVPIRLDAPEWRSRRGIDWVMLVGRARPGVSRMEADAELATLGAALAAEYPDANEGETFAAVPLRDMLVGDTRAPLLAMWGAVCAVLLVVCANLGSLSAARALRRGRELAIRHALGSGRWGLARQLLVEGAILGFGACLLGLLTGTLALRWLLSLAPPDTPRIAQVTFGLPAIGAALAAGLLAGCGATLLPALRAATTRHSGETLASGTRSARSRVRGTFVVGQVAASVCLVVMAGLLIQSLWRLTRVDPGFDAGGLLTVGLPLVERRLANNAERAQHYQSLVEAVRAVPGVASADLVNALPLRNAGPTFSFGHHDPPADVELLAGYRVITPGYFDTLRIPIVEGRSFRAEEDAAGPPVVVVDAAFAERFFPGRPALGAEIELLGAWRRIVGVVGAVRDSALESPGSPRMYVSLPQASRQNLTLAVRTTGDPLSLLSPVRTAIRGIDPEQVLADPAPMADWLGRSLAGDRFLTRLLVSFSLATLVLASVGVYGLLVTSVDERRREIGVRMALGGTRRRIGRMVIGQGMALAAAGLGFGLVAAWLAAGALEPLLFDMDAADPVAFGIVPLVLGAIAGVASWIPARRASRMDPIEALRES